MNFKINQTLSRSHKYSFLCMYMNPTRNLLIVVLFFAGNFSFAQSGNVIGGNYVYQYLNIPASARVASLGGTYITAKDDDINSGMQAASLLNSEMNKALTFSGVTYADGIKFGNVAFAKHYDKVGTFLASMNYAGYGQFLETDEFGNIVGSFKASDYALTLGYGKDLNRLFSYGAAIKFLYSDYYIFNSFGIAADLSATYCDTTRKITATVQFKNIGRQLKNYVDGADEPLPAEALIGISKRLAHTPLRFNFTYRHLEKFDLTYEDPLDLGDVDPVTGEAQIKTINFWNKLSRHFVVAAEILVTKNFHINGGYNFQRRKELAISSRPGLSGFSFGVSMKISKFIISYGRASYHLAGGADHFSITTNLAEFVK